MRYQSLVSMIACVTRACVAAIVISCGSVDQPSAQHGEGAGPACSRRLESGKALEARGHYAEALELYEPCFEDLLERIGILSKNYNYMPARHFLTRRRDELERSIESTLAGGSRVSDDDLRLLVSLNSWLEDDNRTLSLYDRFIGDPKLSASARTLHNSMWEELVDARRYEDALRWETDVRDIVYGLLAQWNTTDEPIEAARHYSIKIAALYMEALLGVERPLDAKILADKVLKGQPSADTYLLLIERAARAGDTDFVTWIYSEAKQRLDSAELQSVESAMQRVAPSSESP
jgi:hypothetical protein